jgi:hypothetical protein
LEAELGTPRPVRRLASSPRSRVWLVEFEGTPAIVKQIVGGPDAADRFARELTALRLAASVRPAVVPELLGSDRHSRVLVLEYLNHRGPTEEWVVDYAVALARLHAAAGAADQGTLPRHVGPSTADVEAFLALAGLLGVSIPPHAPSQLADLCERLATTTQHALLHGDPCPGNDMYTADGVRFVDLEQASLGNGLTELAYLRIGFPTCWCSIATPQPLREQAELAYHDQWRASTGTDPRGDLADVCTGWLIQGDALVERAHRNTIDHLARVTHHNWKWGTVSARQRLLHRTAVVAALADDRTVLTDVGRLSQALHDRMLQRWPKARDPLPTTRTHNS